MMILYFSGTGNSAYVAKKIAEQTGSDVRSINDFMKKKKFFLDKNEKEFVFVVPTYAWRIPKVVEQWIMRSEFDKKVKVYFVMTCGGDIGNASAYVKRLCEQKDFIYMGCAEIVMPENYIAMFSAPNEETAKKIVETANPKIEELIECIRKGHSFLEEKKSLMGKISSGPINNIFYPLFVHAAKFRADEKCIGCKKCETVCPLNNINIEGKKPIWGKKCTHCMACITECPTGAIEYGKKSVGQPRYHCPY